MTEYWKKSGFDLGSRQKKVG